MATNKKSQSELITTVLLILISITAVVIVSSFVINMVRQNLKGTECFQTTGQLSIDTSYSYFNDQTLVLHLMIERGEKDFNLTGINIVYGNEFGTKKLAMKPGTGNPSNIMYIQTNGTPTNNIALPDSSETKVYTINVNNTGISSVSTAILEAVVGKDISCGKVDEQTISFKRD